MVRHTAQVLVAALALLTLSTTTTTTAFAPLSTTTIHSTRSTTSHHRLQASVEPTPQQEKLPEIPFVTSTVLSDRSQDLMIGEDAGVFEINQESWGALGERGWYTFCAAVGTILTAVAVLWIYPVTGYSDDFVAGLESIAGGNPHIVTLLFGIIFPLVHSGLASLRPYGEQVVGSRIWRVIFAFPSLCLAFSWIAYFIAHAHDGVQFYDVSGNPVAHTVAWMVNFLSFFFLHPSVFNLKEVAAVEKPTLHLWETGMIRM